MGFQSEGMQRPVPGNVDKTNQLLVSPRADPSEAVSVYLSPPIILEDSVVESLSVQPVYFLVAELTSPDVRNIHRV